jgi:hypothetical protein
MQTQHSQPSQMGAELKQQSKEGQSTPLVWYLQRLQQQLMLMSNVQALLSGKQVRQSKKGAQVHQA